jgi:hypothetical protein
VIANIVTRERKAIEQEAAEICELNGKPRQARRKSGRSQFLATAHFTAHLDF